MSDSIKDELFLINPFIKDLEQIALSKKDKIMQISVQNALDGFKYQDIEPSLELLVNYIEDKNLEVQSVCVRAFQDLFTSKQFDFFLPANHSSVLLKSLVNIISTIKAKSLLFTEACQCLTYFLLSSNQQLYIHNDEIDFLLENLLLVHSKNSNEIGRKSIEAILKRFLHNLESMSAKSSEKVDDYICSDIKTSTDSLVKIIQNENIVPDTASLIISLLESVIFEAAPIFKETEAYQHILIVELPQLFIQYSLTAPDSIFKLLLNLFIKFISLGQPVLISFPTIIDQMIIPAIDNNEKNPEQSLRALTLLSKFCDFDENPYLISVFTISDCNPNESKRVFENTFQAITKMAMDNVMNPPKVNSCLSFLNNALSSFQKFFISKSKPANSNTSSSNKASSSPQDENNDNDNLESSSEEKPEMDIKIINQERQVLDKKMTVEDCSKLFNENPKKGIKLILSSNLAEDTPSSIASFIKSCQLLDPAIVSEYLSRQENAQTLTEYIKTFNFQKMTIDNALRELCSQFRLPGEAQQIDRVMVAFASQYHNNNPSVMSEDAAYVISFSIIMLHTDIHNPNVTKKITCDEWIENTRNVKEACEVEIPYLADVYHRIVAKPMKDITFNQLSDSKKLIRRGKKQLQKLMSDPELIRKKVTITREILLLAFDRLWSTLFATFSLCIQGIQDDTTVSLALNGQKSLVFFLSHFRMTKELESVVSFICVFCTSAETDQRRVSGVETVLKICNEDGDEFGETSWLPILDLFSTLMRNSTPIEINTPIDSETPLTVTQPILNLPSDKIEKIYSDTVNLNHMSFISFVKCLCRVSNAEIFTNPPSLFSFKRVVDVAILNIHRVRFVWSQAWTIFNSHFSQVGCLAHQQISMFAVEQLAKVVTFIIGINNKINPRLQNQQTGQTESSEKEKNEKSENDGKIENNKWYHFQREILMPFCTIFQNQTLYEPRRYIINALDQLTKKLEDLNMSSMISTAWDVLLDIFEIAAMDKSSEIVQKSFSILERSVTTIPDKNLYSSKAAVVLIKIANQNIIPEIKIAAMSLSIAFSLKIDPITPSFFNIVQTALTVNSDHIISDSKNVGLKSSESSSLPSSQQISEISKDVMSLGANLYFLLILKYYSSTSGGAEQWESIENMYILPLFATPKKELQVQLMHEVFRTLLPSAGEKTLSLIPQITQMFIEINDVEVLEPLTREIVDLARSDSVIANNNENENDKENENKDQHGNDATSVDLIKNISIQTLELIFNSASVRPEMAQTLFNRIPPRLEFLDVIISCTQQSMNLQSVSLVRKGLGILFSLFDQFKDSNNNKNSEEEDNQEMNPSNEKNLLSKKVERVADIIITVMMFINSQVSDAAKELFSFVFNVLCQNQFRCVKSKKVEFQRAIFAFFLNDSRGIREIAKEMAEKSQQLFTS